LTAVDAARASRAFRRRRRRRLLIVEVAEAVVERAMDLAERYGLRGYDAVHLAAALAVADMQGASGCPP